MGPVGALVKMAKQDCINRLKSAFSQSPPSPVVYTVTCYRFGDIATRAAALAEISWSLPDKNINMRVATALFPPIMLANVSDVLALLADHKVVPPSLPDWGLRSDHGHSYLPAAALVDRFWPTVLRLNKLGDRDTPAFRDLLTFEVVDILERIRQQLRAPWLELEVSGKQPEVRCSRVCHSHSSWFVGGFIPASFGCLFAASFPLIFVL